TPQPPKEATQNSPGRQPGVNSPNNPGPVGATDEERARTGFVSGHTFRHAVRIGFTSAPLGAADFAGVALSRGGSGVQLPGIIQLLNIRVNCDGAPAQGVPLCKTLPLKRRRNF